MNKDDLKIDKVKDQSLKYNQWKIQNKYKQFNLFLELFINGFKKKQEALEIK